MANVLTDLAADIFVAADIVGREQVGAIPSVTINANDSERAAVGDTIRSAFTRGATAVNISPSMTIPEGTDQTVDNKTASITKARGVQIPWTGEDIKHVNNGAGFSTIYGDQIAQAMRTIVNEMELDLMTALLSGASRAYGTAGTTPFASDIKPVNFIRQILVENGCPMDGQVSLVLSSEASTNLRNVSNLQKVNEGGDATLLRNGVLLPLSGMLIRETAQAVSHTKGSGTLYDAAGGNAIGDTTLALDGGTAGATGILGGDVVTFAGDTNKYVVNTGLASASGNIVIGGPGLRETLADTVEMTIGDSYTQNVAFHRNAVELIVRPPALPNLGGSGDAAVDRMLVQDPFSGLVFEISVYQGFKKAMIEVAAVWGVKVWKPNFVATLLG